MIACEFCVCTHHSITDQSAFRVNNAGVQKPLDFSGKVDENEWISEININIIGLVKLCQLFIPHLASKEHHSAIINIGSGLSFVPASSIPVYSATKAFVMSFTMSIRHQLRKTSIAVIEISPPLVDTDLHRDAHDPEGYSTKTNPRAMSQEVFVKEVMEALNAGEVEIGAGFVKGVYQTWKDAFSKTFGMLNPN